MLRRALALCGILTALAGCEGCDDLWLFGMGVPFSHTIEGTMRLSFGNVDAQCSGSGHVDAENGIVTYQHAPTDDGLCALGAAWTGTLIDTAAAKEQVDAEIAARGFDPEVVDIEFTKVTFAVGAVSFRDADGADLTPPSIPSYRGVLQTQDRTELIVVEHDGDGDPTDPAVHVNDTPSLVADVNAAWDTDASIPGTGAARAVVDMDTAAAFADVDEPGLELEYAVTVEALLRF
jgi:hypothetical protein